MSRAIRPFALALRSASAALVAFGAGCASRHSSESALSPAGPQAQRIADLFWLFCAVSVVVWLLVMLFFGIALARRQKTPSAALIDPDLEPSETQERRLWTVVGGFIGLTILTLLGLLVGEFLTARANHTFGETAQNQVSIQITGHQWWWEVQYKDATPSNGITTANELVIPVGRPVGIELQSADVIHSFWMPNLQGKKDLVPGHPSIIWLQADKPGVYWGECAEFCGFQHAQMRMVVKAVPQGEFDTWLASSRTPAPGPATESEKRGQQVFMSSSCVLCHQISGTHAFGRIGPDLSKVGSRSIIAAGALTNTPQNMAKWLADPQAIKPGTQMPTTALSPEDLQALTDYLESLK